MKKKQKDRWHDEQHERMKRWVEQQIIWGVGAWLAFVVGGMIAVGIFAALN